MPGVYCFSFVCVRLLTNKNNISESIYTINFIFGGNIPSDKMMKGFDFKKIRHKLRPGGCGGVCVCVWIVP